MYHPETYTVTDFNGPRPKGRPDECFYCGRKLGEEHAPECVARERTVMIRVAFDLAVAVPEHWEAEQIEHYHNSHPMGVTVQKLADAIARAGGAVPIHVTLLRECTAEDEETQQFYG